MFNAFRFSVIAALLAGLAVAAAPPQAAQASPAASIPPATDQDLGRPEDATADRVQTMLGELPLIFVVNRGQVDERVAYYVHGSRTGVYFAADGVFFVLSGPGEEPDSRERYALKLAFVGGNPGVAPVGRDQRETNISYFRGSPEQWKTALPTYSEVVYADLWPGIDLVYSGDADHLKYTFVLQPGADPGQIRLAYRGATQVVLGDSGALAVSTPLGGFEDQKPMAYQEEGDQRVAVAAEYALDAQAHSYGFQVGAYDRSRPLVIDPAVLVYAGYIGGEDDDEGNGIAVDGSGNAYVVGTTESDETKFPDGDGFGTLPGPDPSYNGNTDAFVAKVKADGTGLDYAGYIGGSANDVGNGIAVDGSGSAYIVGSTQSTAATFPDTGGPDLTHNGGWDGFVAKVKADGSGLEYCGYIGGSDSDYGTGIAVDGSGNGYVVGYTGSDHSTFPVVAGPDLTFNGFIDAFVVKVKADGSGLDYAGYIGGSNSDYGHGIAVDGSGNAYITGEINSTQVSFPDGDGMGTLTGPDRTYNGGFTDAFVAKVLADGSGLAYAGYIGGEGADAAYGIDVYGSSNAYITGGTHSDQLSFPDGDGFGTLTGPDTSHNGFTDAFVAKVKADGSGLDYAGYIGGGGAERGNGIAVDATGAADITGITSSDERSFPDGDGFGTLAGPDTTFNGHKDAFVVKVLADGSGLVYAGYIGGWKEDSGHGIAVDGSGNAYVTGLTLSTPGTFPEKVGPDTHWNGAQDCFVAKIQPPFATLSVSKVGSGSGTVTSSPAGINCGVDCSEDCYEGTDVTLTATPDDPFTSFVGWSGDCDPTTGNVTMSSNKSCTATFTGHDHWGDSWSGSGTGLTLTSSDGTGLYGRSDASSGTTYGVYGRSQSTSGRGVYGYTSASSGATYGVYGNARSTSGRGVYGYTSATSGTTYGLYGNARSTSGRGVLGYTSASSGITYGVYGKVNSPDGWAGKFMSTAGNGVYISTPGGKTGLNVAGGTKNAVVRTNEGSRLLYAEESTEVWFSDHGFGQMQEGVAIIAINPIFAQTVNLHEPYHVFLEEYGDAELYVAERGPERFEVRGGRGDANVQFSYRLMAKGASRNNFRF